VPSEVVADTGLAVAVAVVAVALVVAAAEGWTSGNSCSHPDSIEGSVELDEVQKASHTALVAEESACEVPRVDHTGPFAEAEVHTAIVAGLVGEEIDRSRN
jgi:hypothetical protein